MRRSDVIKEITRLGGLIISNLGYASRELYASGDSKRNFYMLGSMGLASSLGLGIASSQKKQVYVLDGDGSILMNLGSLATIANYAPRNYCLIIIDNKAYGSTGNQATNTSRVTDLVKIASGAGNRNVKRVKTIAELRSVLKTFKKKCSVIVAETDQHAEEVPIIPLTTTEIKERFMGEIHKENRVVKKQKQNLNDK